LNSTAKPRNFHAIKYVSNDFVNSNAYISRASRLWK